MMVQPAGRIRHNKQVILTRQNIYFEQVYLPPAPRQPGTASRTKVPGDQLLIHNPVPPKLRSVLVFRICRLLGTSTLAERNLGERSVGLLVAGTNAMAWRATSER